MIYETFTVDFSAACSAVFFASFSAGKISSAVVGDFIANILLELSAVVFAAFHADFFLKGRNNYYAVKDPVYILIRKMHGIAKVLIAHSSKFEPIQKLCF